MKRCMRTLEEEDGLSPPHGTQNCGRTDRNTDQNANVKSFDLLCMLRTPSCMIGTVEIKLDSAWVLNPIMLLCDLGQ